MQSPKREIKLNIASYDLLKGFLILLVVLAHMFHEVDWINDPVLTAFYRYAFAPGIAAMPAFLIISGYSFKVKDPVKLLKSSAKSLCVPCFWIMVATMILAPIPYYVLRYQAIKPAAYELICRMLGYMLGLAGPNLHVNILGFELWSCGPIWFFWALFVAQNVMNLILRNFKEFWKQAAAVLICTAAGYALMKLQLTFYCIGQGLFSVSFCYLGYLLKQRKVLQRCVFDVRTYILLVPVTIAEMTWGTFDLWSGTFNNVILDCIGTACMSILLIIAGIWLGQFEWKCTDFLKEMGVYSFWILSVHTVEMFAFPWRELHQFLPEDPRVFLVILTMIRLVVIAAGVLFVKKLSKYNYARKNKKRISAKAG